MSTYFLDFLLQESVEDASFTGDVNDQTDATPTDEPTVNVKPRKDGNNQVVGGFTIIGDVKKDARQEVSIRRWRLMRYTACMRDWYALCVMCDWQVCMYMYMYICTSCVTCNCQVYVTRHV